jgi:O-antigen ligase
MRRTVLHLSAPLAVALLYSLWSGRPLWADVALVLVLALAVRATWQGWPPDELRRAGVTFIGTYSLAAQFSSDPLTSWRTVLGVAAYGLIFVLAGNLMALGVSRAALYRGLVLTAHVLFAALLTVWLMDGAQLYGYRLRYESVNSFALVNLLLMPALVVGELRGLVIAEAVAVAWLSGSRSGMGGLVAGLMTLGGARVRLPRWVWVGMGLAVAVAGLALAARGSADLLGSSGRSQMWAVAWRLFADSPLLGQGPGTYKAAWMAANPAAFDTGHAHNLYLNLAAESGLLGLAAGAWLIVAVVRALSRAGTAWSTAAMAGTVGLLVLSLGDVPTTAPYIVVTWLVLVQLGLDKEPSDATDKELF